MMQSKWIACLTVAGALAGCSVPDHEEFVHNAVRGSSPSPKKRQLVVFMDGTGNDVRSRTNIRRLFEMTVARSNPDVLAYYDPGVGTGDKFYLRALGGPFGFKFQSNLREAMTFLTENYQDGDEISIFGFSRGAYSAGVLASLVSGAGIPVLKPDSKESVKARHNRAEEAVSSYYNALHRAELNAEDQANSQMSNPMADFPEVEAKQWRQNYWNSLTGSKSSVWNDQANRKRPKIAVLGLWDPVDSLVNGILPALKVAWSVSAKSEFDRHRGHHFHPFVLGPGIENFYLAASLDEERQPFSLELPDHALGQPQHYEIVGFIGDHSDLGGGHYGDKDLSGISFNWMLSHVGSRLLGPGGDRIRVYENYSGARHDLYVGSLYHKGAFRIRGEFLGSRATLVKPDPKRKNALTGNDAPHLAPVRSEGWKIKIHESVLKRMQSGKDYFYKADSDDDAVNLAKENLHSGSDKPYINARNPIGTYRPRALRNLPVVGAGSQNWTQQGWTKHDLTVQEIRSRYEIVQD